MPSTPRSIPELNFNFMRDIAPVAGIGRTRFVMIVNPSVPAKTVPEFIAYAKANPGTINMASQGNGTAPHVFGELFKMMAGVDLVHVPYRGDFMADLLGGRVQVAFDPIVQSIEHIRGGRLRALAMTGATRAAALPDVPTVAEFLPGYEASGWQGIGAPKNTPAEIIDTLNKAINAIVADPEMTMRSRRDRRRADGDDARRLRPIHRRRDREMGQSNQVRGHQAGVIRRDRCAASH